MNKFTLTLLLTLSPLMALGDVGTDISKTSNASGDKSANTTKDLNLTFFGAEVSGNKHGTIPAWNGGILSPPAAYKKGDWHPDPFVQDQVLFTINHSNIEQYKHQVSAGHQALMAKYPDTFHNQRMASRRSGICTSVTQAGVTAAITRQL